MHHPHHRGHPRARGARASRSAAALAWALPAFLAGCAPPAEAPALEDYNVLLIVVDTLGARHVGAYADDAATPGSTLPVPVTPHIDALAAGAVRFSRAYSTAPWTQPALASIFTARMPSAHGVQNIRDVLPPERTTLGELLEERGYATAGVISHHLISADLGYAQGFASYDETAVAGHGGLSSDAVTDLAIRRIDERGAEPFFLFTHYFDPHYAYRHHPEFDRTSGYTGRLAGVDDIWAILELRPELDAADIAFLRGRHLEETAFVDHHVGRLLAHLSAAGLDESTIVVFVADHGEEFMDHGWIGHTRTLYEELIHVPLIVKIPGRTLPAVVASPVSILDILPTLLGMSRRAVADDAWEGVSWLPFLSGEQAWPEEREVVAEVNFMPPSIRQREKLAFKTALIRGDLKVVHDRQADTWDLFHLAEDPGERADGAAEAPAEAELMRRRLGLWESTRDLPTEFTLAPPEGLSDEELERLRALGYVQ